MRIPRVEAPELPAPSHPGVWRCALTLRSLVPIFGGGAEPRRWDADQPLRGPSILGQLRHWWRATVDLAELAALQRAEADLFGRIGPGGARASLVRLRSEGRATGVAPPPELDWALWVCRGDGAPPQERFCVLDEGRLVVSGPEACAEGFERALRAWVLLGGVGGRVRRGLGALWADEIGRPASGGAWAEVVQALAPSAAPRSWPSLAGVRCAWDRPVRTAHEAVGRALDALRAARSMREIGRGRYDGSHRIRQIQEHDWLPIRDGTGAYGGYAAAFGLPIQYRSHDGRHFGGRRIVRPVQPGHDRLPSPVWVRPVPLAGGGFLPALVVLRAWARPEVSVGATRLRGRADPRALDLLLEHLQARSGWTVAA